MDIEKAKEFYQFMNTRRSVRKFTQDEIPLEIIEECVKTAGTAPSGANRQPWFFAIVKDPEMKKKIRDAAEKEEYEFYNKRADDKFLKDLEVFKTDWNKPNLEQADTLIVIFSKAFDMVDGEKLRCYYPLESVGIATGMLITALHKQGLSTLTHTPNPMGGLAKVLDRPKGERAYLILLVGKQHPEYIPPNITRKELGDISKVY